MSDKNLTGYPSIDKPWLKYYSEEAINAHLPECTVFENIFKRNGSRAKDIALEYYSKKITYGELFRNVEAAKQAYERVGVKKGDIVVMVTSSTPETVYSVLALCRIGAVANMINPFFEPQQMIDRIGETGAKVLVVLDRLYNNIALFADKLPVKTKVIIPVTNSMPATVRLAASIKLGRADIPYSEATITWSDFIKSTERFDSKPDAEYEKDRPLIMVYSSGTTGASKGIVLTNDGINATITHYDSDAFPYNRGDRFLQVIPVWFSTGIVLSVLMPLCMSVTTILEPVFNEKIFAQDIAKYKPNMTIAATSLWVYAATSSELKNTDLSFMDYPITGGEKVIESTETMLNAFLAAHKCNSKLLKGYGMCELGSTISTDSKIMIKTCSVGIPISKVLVSAFDISTNKELKYNERGEIRVLSPARMKGYFKNPEATADFFYADENGNIWGCTGDIGYVDEDGFVYILGRANDSYKAHSGRTVYCFDVEEVILQHRAVSHCKVVGVKHIDSELAVVHIVLESNVKIDTETLVRELHQLCIEQLDNDSIPFGYIIRESMPIKNSGKLNVEQLKSERTDILRIADNKVTKIDLMLTEEK